MMYNIKLYHIKIFSRKVILAYISISVTRNGLFTLLPKHWKFNKWKIVPHWYFNLHFTGYQEGFFKKYEYTIFSGGSLGKEPTWNVGEAWDKGSILGSGRPPGEAHDSILAWRIPLTEKPGGLQSAGLQWVGHDWYDWACTHTLFYVLETAYLS